MTSQKDQIQALIAEIDGVLQKTTPRLPWVMSGEMAQQRQVLERVRNYLVVSQRRMLAAEGGGQSVARPDLLAHDIYYQQPQASYPPESSQRDRSSEMSAQQMLQAVVQEMGYLRSNLMQPLQTDVEMLRQQRDALAQEIQQLETQRQYYGPGQPQVTQQQIIHDFLQALMGRLQETLSQQVAQTMRTAGNQPLVYADNPALPSAAPATNITADPYQQSLQLIQAQQARSDEMLVKLDSTLSVVFESLQRNVKAYEESLSQGLEKMHSLGQQGEMMFNALVNHLAEKLGREASSYLQSPTSPVTGSALPGVRDRAQAGLTSAGSASGQISSGAVAPGSTPSATGQSAVNLPLPFPGTELPLSSKPVESVPAAFSGNLGSAELNIAELDLGDLDLSQMSTEDIDELLQLDTSLAEADLMAAAGLSPSSSGAASASQPSTSSAEEDTADIDAALKLLEQLSSELDKPTGTAAADTQIERALASPPSTTDPIADERISEDARDELDEFYESLFGANAVTAESATSERTPTAESELAEAVEPSAQVDAVAQPPADPTLGWDLFSKPTAESEITSSPVSPSSGEAASPEMAEPEASIFQPDADTIDLSNSDLQIATADVEPTPGVEPTLVSNALDPYLDEISLLTDLFRQPLSQESDSTPQAIAYPSDQANDSEVAAQIDQSLALTPDEEALLSLGQIQPPTTTNLSDDRYTPALPEEDLLPTDESLEELDQSLWLDETTLSSLDADLTRFEEGIVSEPLQADDETTELTGLDESAEALPLDDLDELTFEDWNDPSLDDFAVALPETGGSVTTSEAVSDSPAVDTDTDTTDADTDISSSPLPISSQSDALTLEGMDDLFADSPAPPVSPVPPPGAIGPDDAIAFTLEGMDDLFADSPAPPVSSVPPPGAIGSDDATAFTLEGMDDLFAEPSQSSLTSPIESEPSIDQPAFTLEESGDLFADSFTDSAPGPDVDNQPVTFESMDELFSDVPLEAKSTDVGLSDTSIEATQSDVTTDVNHSAAEPILEDEITLEGIDELFTDVPPVTFEAATEFVPPTEPAEAGSDETTLADIDNLFTDPPPVASEPASPQPVLEPEPSTEPLTPAINNLTLEGMDDLFADLPPAPTPLAVSAEPPLPNAPPAKPPAPFTVERIDDLFMEVPDVEATSESPTVESAADQPAEFTLERLNDLFVEVPLTDTPASSIAPEASQSESGIDTQELTLDQAFESLMGTSVEPAPTEPSTEENPEKKKEIP